MRYRDLSHRVRNTDGGRFEVTITGERRQWFWFRWRPFAKPIRFRPRGIFHRAETASFHSRIIAERAAALMLEKSESFTVDDRRRRSRAS